MQYANSKYVYDDVFVISIGTYSMIIRVTIYYIFNR